MRKELTVFEGFQSASWKRKQILSRVLNAQRWIPWEQHQCTWPQRDTKHNPGKHVKHLLLCIGGNKKMSTLRADLELITVVLTVLKRLNSVLLHDTEPLITVFWPLGNQQGKNQTKQSITHKRRVKSICPPIWVFCFLFWSASIYGAFWCWHMGKLSSYFFTVTAIIFHVACIRNKLLKTL